MSADDAALTATFISRKAALTATLMELTVFVVCMAMLWICNSATFLELALLVGWHGTAWVVGALILPWVAGRGAALPAWMEIFCTVALISLAILPRGMTTTCNSGASASASVVLLSRGLCVLRDPSNFKSWSRWRFMFYFTCFGWHDFRTAKRAKGVSSSRMLSMFCLALLTMVSLAGGIIVLGRPSFTDGVMPLLIKVYLRGALGSGCLMAAFCVFDLKCRLIYLLVLQIEVQKVFGEVPVVGAVGRCRAWMLWLMGNCTSLRQFWGSMWNQPVHRLLADGVYRPLRAAKCHPQLCVLMVFGTSGAGHLYAINAMGMPLWAQVSILSFFLVQPLLLELERRLEIRGEVPLFLMLTSFACLFVEPMLFCCSFGFAQF